ncbi:MAG TPA: ATP-dependent helicase HrpB [Tepidisphaeraceae bacterium]|jgi:ATP-dependent helicase HrpB|nr:ATP-dependent helicase HrpB [Tepidisphaeraceae bacterium]
MLTLPIDQFLPQITQTAKEHRALILVAEPGAGKTTRVAPALLKHQILTPENPTLIMLQPRRVAARASAERIAEENAWQLGHQVGYQIRFERRMTDQTRLRVMTEGILTRQLVDDPFLTGVGCVILDEFHERSLHTDVAAALLREIQRTVRNDLILIVMSATLDADPVSEFFGNAPFISVPGRTFPVDISYQSPTPGSTPPPLWERAAHQIQHTLANSTGDILVFLPGVMEIQRTLDLLTHIPNTLLLPLHGSLTPDQQHAALRPALPHLRKIICATNIAETSLTIDGVKTVIDTGMARIATYDPRRGLDRLELKRISQASATQRAGRAGRTGPGHCIRLWSQRENASLDPFELPEIRRVDLAATVLTLHAWGEDPRTFSWYEKPSDESLDAAEQLLEMLGALTAERNGKITELGHRILSVPAHPRLGRLMVDAADRGLIQPGAAIAALLSEKDILLPDRFSPAKERGPSDLLKRLELLENPNHRPDIDTQSLRSVQRTQSELTRIGQRITQTKSRPFHSNDDNALLKLILAAYPDRVCRRRASDRETAIMVGGTGVRIARESLVQDAEFFVAIDARSDDRSRQREAIVRIASQIEESWLEELFPHEVQKKRSAIFDPQTQRIIGVSGTYYRDLTLREERNVAVDPQTAGQVLADALLPTAQSFFDRDDTAKNLLARVALLREHLPEHPWPIFDDAELREVFTQACAGRRSVEEITSARLSESLMTQLPWPLDRLLEEHAPESLTVPTGNRIKLQYETGKPPVLAVRLQEIFGLTQTPRLAQGRVPVLLHLLGPNYRPVQITADLQSFWANTYFQVRKDLRAQYPKHSWPADPLTAPPVAKGRRRN